MPYIHTHTGAIAAERAYFDEGDGHIFLDEVACSGNEMTILQCLSTDAGLHNCYHDEDAGVVCPGLYLFSVHLSHAE